MRGDTAFCYSDDRKEKEEARNGRVAFGGVHGHRHRQDLRGGLAGCTASLFRLHGSAGSGAQLSRPSATPAASVTTVTGIRGNGMTGDFTIGTGGATAGVLYTLPSLTPAPYPNASRRPSTSPAPPATRPTGRASARRPASCASAAATRRRPTAAAISAISIDGANAPGQQLTTLRGAANGPINTHRPLHLRQPGRRQLRHRHAAGNAFLYDIAERHLHHHQPPGRRKHHRLRRLRQPHRRRLRPGPACRGPTSSTRTPASTRLRRARRRHRGHAFRGHHRRRPRQHLQPGGRFGRRPRRRTAWVVHIDETGRRDLDPRSPCRAPA